MRIEEIARLAGVSMSTVSKIVNGKDQGINQKTRERVLAIVKEYNYTPYSSVKNTFGTRSFLIGFLSAGSPEMTGVQAGVIECAQNGNYSIVTLNSGGDPERERKNITMLLRNNVDGVIWEKVGEESHAWEEHFRERNIPLAVVGYSAGDPSQEEAMRIDYTRLGYNAARRLVELGHRRLGCMIHPGKASAAPFLRGFRRCLFEHQILFDEKNSVVDANLLDHKVFLLGLTGFVCADEASALELCRLAELQGLKIPENLSVISLSGGGGDGRLTRLPLPLYAYGGHVCGALIGRIEKTGPESPDAFDWDIAPEGDASVSVPYDSRSKGILVVGAINMDVLMNMDELPQAGKTVNAHSITTIPGGKGLNQAVGAAKLGANAALIARVGRDYEGAGIHSILSEHRVDAQGVSTDDRASTGKAYIYVQADGDSSIIIYAGANRNLGPEDITRSEALFKNAGYCLIPSELPPKTIEFTVEMARRHKVKIIMKPAALRTVTDALLRKVDIFVPNEKEAALLCPQLDTVEERAGHFLAKGAGTVIITLGARGCYLKSKTSERHFPAAPFKALDTTGGADAFISALAVFLAEGYDMAEAIRTATCAAGFCVSRQGTMPAMVDRTTLELYMARKPEV